MMTTSANQLQSRFNDDASRAECWLAFGSSVVFLSVILGTLFLVIGG
jgi:hypothetical protein